MKKLKIDKKGLPPEVARDVASLCESLIVIHGNNLLSISVYGSVLSKNYIPKVSNINLVCVFSELTTEALNLSLKVIKLAVKKRIVPPLFLSLDYIKSSLDSFPMEFIEIQENHRTIYGTDCFADIQIPLKHLRLQCEQKLKSQLVRLRQTYLEYGKNRKLIKQLLLDSLGNNFPIFRNILRVCQHPIPELYEDVLMKISGICNFDAQVYLDMLRDKKKTDKILWKEIDSIFGEYVLQLELLSNFIDKMKVSDN
ncbi:hypothetical protein J7L67_09975 [bacterium]|nr:hypothetical protein [bacterium]